MQHIAHAHRLRLGRFSEKGCSGSINPDTNLGGNLATVNEVFNGQQTSIIYDRI